MVDVSIERYIQTSWIIKIRLMSARLQLWDEHYSLIHLENACLQIRKICECIAQLCLISADINSQDYPRKWRKNCAADKILKWLREDYPLNFLIRVNLTLFDSESMPRRWNLELKEPLEEDRDRVIKIFTSCGEILHQTSPYKPFPYTIKEAPEGFMNTRNAMRDNLVWLWNFIWGHRILIADPAFKLFCVYFQSRKDMERPVLIIPDGLLNREIEFEFDPEFISDFLLPLNWNKFDKNL